MNLFQPRPQRRVDLQEETIEHGLERAGPIRRRGVTVLVGVFIHVEGMHGEAEFGSCELPWDTAA